MNKGELIDYVASEAGISRAQANAAMDAFTSAVGNALRDGDRVTLVGFGTFSVSERAARNGRNPQTGETIKIAARRVPRFKAGKEFASGLSGGAKKKAAAKAPAAKKAAAPAAKKAAAPAAKKAAPAKKGR